MTPLIYGPGPGDPATLHAVRDLAGLPVDDVAERPVGEVYGLLIEEGSGLIRYLDIAERAQERHVLAPIGHTRLEDHADGTRVRLRAAMREDLAEIPAYDRTDPRLDEAYESVVLAAYSALFYGERYYAHPAYDHHALYAGLHPVVAARTDGGSRLVALSTLVPPAAAAAAEADAATAHDDAAAAVGPAASVLGAEVRAADGVHAGRVVDLLVQRDTGLPRYGVVEREDATRVPIPIGYLTRAPAGAGGAPGGEAQAAPRAASRERVRLQGLRAAELASFPVMEPGATLDRDGEDALRAALERALSGERRFDRIDFASAATPQMR